MQNVFAENFFLLGNFQLFSFVKCLSAQERMYANIHISWWMLTRAVMGIFRSRIQVKSSKSFCRGNFLFVPFNALFYVWTMRQCFKNIPAKFQSRPTLLAGFFSKRVTDDDDRRKTFFLASCCEYSSLIYRVVTMEYRSSGGMCRMAFWTCCSSSRRQSIQFELAIDLILRLRIGRAAHQLFFVYVTVFMREQNPPSQPNTKQLTPNSANYEARLPNRLVGTSHTTCYQGQWHDHGSCYLNNQAWLGENGPTSVASATLL